MSFCISQGCRIFLIFLVCGIFLSLLSFLDYFTYKSKRGGIPSVITSLFLIIMFVAGDYKSGLLAGLMSLLFTDLDLWGGWADFKVFVASAMAFDMLWVLIYSGLLCLLAIIFKFSVKKLDKRAKNMPFIPVIALSFIITYIIQIFV